ncbi:MAG: hypothetical protein ACOC6R_00300 [Chloroflexota bacterium]
MKNKKGTIAAVTAAVAAYMDEEEKAVRPAMLQQRPVMVSGSRDSSGHEELMRMLWQREIIARAMVFGGYPEIKL